MNPYEAAGDVLLEESGCTVRKYRKAMTGKAYIYTAEWEIAAPRPRGPISFGVFAHEIAHQLYHRHGSKPRWIEEVEAEDWALAQFDRFGLKGRERYEDHAIRHLGGTFARAIRRSPRLLYKIMFECQAWWDRLDGRWTDRALEILDDARRKLADELERSLEER